MIFKFNSQAEPQQNLEQQQHQSERAKTTLGTSSQNKLQN